MEAARLTDHENGPPPICSRLLGGRSRISGIHQKIAPDALGGHSPPSLRMDLGKNFWRVRKSSPFEEFREWRCKHLVMKEEKVIGPFDDP